MPTDGVWTTCEELPVPEEVTERGSRYLHAIFSKTSHRITHLDGSIRIYGQDELTARAATHLRTAGKAGIRVKVFRTDRPIPPEVLGGIAETFFFWNYDVARYFGVQYPEDF